MSSFKSRVICTFSSCIFQSKNIISWYPLFLYLLCNLRDYYFQCVVSNFYHENCMSVFRMLHGRGIWYLVVCDLGVVQVRLDVLNLEKLEN